eukprot:11096241-Alexandrium_andersonii.AAC.1
MHGAGAGCSSFERRNAAVHRRANEGALAPLCTDTAGEGAGAVKPCGADAACCSSSAGVQQRHTACVVR